jgi:putative tricarboxylic transport membrane protein
VQILRIPYSILAALIVVFCEIGAYSIDNNVTGVLLMNIFGLVGYLMKRYEFAGAPLILALVLGPMFENSLRRSLMLSHGSAMIFFTRPLSAIFLIIAIVFLISPLFSRQRIGKKVIEMQDQGG